MINNQVHRCGLVILLGIVIYLYLTLNMNRDRKQAASMEKKTAGYLPNVDDDLVAGDQTEQVGADDWVDTKEDQVEEEQGEEEEEGDVDSDEPQDFRNRAQPIPESDWPRLDNLSCVKRGLPDYPDDHVMLRSPAVLLIGAMKAGTTALNKYLLQHKRVCRMKRKEFHFYDFKFEPFATTNGILREQARKKLTRLMERQNLQSDLMFERKKLFVVDDSPRYLFWSDRIPARVLCVTPWVKILAILRNPIDRAYSQFNMKDTLSVGKEETQIAHLRFEAWVKKDMDDLVATGVVQDKIPREEFAGSPEEMQAWKRYTRLGTHAPIGRGLYAIQLRHWFDAFEKEGKRDDFLIIHSERMRKDTEGVYKDVLSFLDIPQLPLKRDDEYFKAKYSAPMKNETRTMLEEFYSSYNKELYDLLGDEWDGVWDPQ